MRWLKHYTDNHRGVSQQYLMDELGHLGPCGYHILTEMCAEKINKTRGDFVSEVDCEFTFHRRVVESAVRSSPAGVRRLLDCCQTLNILSFEYKSDFILIKMPMLLNLLGSDLKKLKKCTHDVDKMFSQNRIEENRIEREQSGEREREVSPQEKNHLLKKIHDPLEYMNPELTHYVEKLRGLQIYTPRVMSSISLIRQRFETVADLEEWVLGVSECNGFKEKESPAGKKHYLLGALFGEIKETSK